MVVPRTKTTNRPSRSSVTLTSRSSATPTSRRGTRYSRNASAFGFSVERPPVILHWDLSILRVGHAEQCRPQHILPWEAPDSLIQSEDEWYSIISPLLSKLWDQLMIDPSSRRVVCVHDPYMPETWESSLKQVLWNLGVPAVSFFTTLETIPYAMGWHRGLVVMVGQREAMCQVHVDGHALINTFQVVPCGYEAVFASDEADNQSATRSTWSKVMDHYWLDERQPQSLMLALLKCLEACPRDVRRDVVSNLVFVGDTLMLVPDLPIRCGRRLVALLQQSATVLEGEPQSDLTVVPTQWATLRPLASYVSVTSTTPHRADLIPWVGANLCATAWHRHDEDDAHMMWNFL